MGLTDENLKEGSGGKSHTGQVGIDATYHNPELKLKASRGMESGRFPFNALPSCSKSSIPSTIMMVIHLPSNSSSSFF